MAGRRSACQVGSQAGRQVGGQVGKGLGWRVGWGRFAGVENVDMIKVLTGTDMIPSYHGKSTPSRPIWAVKHRWARLVLR